MKIVAVFKEFSDHGREVLDWIRDFEERAGVEVEKLEPESKEGEAFCRARDIVEYPTIAVVNESDGKTYEMWSGRPLPSIDNVEFYIVN